jgi:hypothetical protein
MKAIGVLVSSLFVLCVVGLALHCTPAPSPVTPSPPDATDGSPAPGPLNLDGAVPSPPMAACEALQAIGCPEGEMVAPCLTAMADLVAHPTLHRSPNGYPLTPQGIATLTSVAQARAMGVLCGADASP